MIAPTLLLALFSAFTFAADSPFDVVKAYVLKGEGPAAYTELSSLKLPAESADQKKKIFALGVLAKDQQKLAEAEKFLRQSSQTDSLLKDYANYFLGEIEKRNGNNKKAEELFNKVLKAKPQRFLQYMARFELSELEVKAKRYRKAYRHLKFLERRWRGNHRHPEIVWRLMNVEILRKRSSSACRWARKMYSKYPGHPLAYDWGIELSKVKHKGKHLGCVATFSDQKRRIRWFQLLGQNQRAKKEIEVLRSKKNPDLYLVDRLHAGFLIQQGFSAEAVKVLLPHYKKNQRSFEYLMLLAKAAARSGQFQTAVGAYYKAYRSRPKSRQGRKALFRAAFLSYQFQDYDGASRKFQEFSTKFRRSGLSRDAEWHLAWVRYLKKDYSGAVTSLESILKKKRRHRRRWRKFSTEKINYWLAMSYYRQQKYEKARPIFEELAADPLMPFYSFAAKYRLTDFPKKEKRNLAAEMTPAPAHRHENLNTGLEQMEARIESDVAAMPIKEEDESEDSINVDSDEDEEDESSKEVAENNEDATDKLEEPEELESDKIIADEDLSKSRFKERFTRAQAFIDLGFYDFAKWELYEIERRTKRQSYLKLLMGAYEKISSYNRSSYIAQIYFSTDRKRYGLDGARYLWDFAYPRAFESVVKSYSSGFNVPKEFVWSIMRAESHYKHDVRSPVGAQGLMQVMPYTGARVAKLMGEITFRPRDLVLPDVNVKIGTRYLRRLLKKFDRQIPLAAAAYNAGPHRVESWLHSFGNLEMDEFIEHIPFIETRNYVKKVIKNYAIYNALGDGEKNAASFIVSGVRYNRNSRPSHRETWEKID